VTVAPGRAAAVAVAAVATAAGAAALARSPAAGPAKAPRVVSVLVRGPGGVADTATGFVVSGGRVVTVAHVLRSGRPVRLRGAGRRWAHARVLRIDRRSDLALLAADGRVVPVIAPPERRTRLLAAANGRPRLLAATVRRDIAATVRDPAGGPAYARAALELAAEVQDGDSGAPLVSADGRLLGVLFARSERRAATAYAVDGAAVSGLLAGA